MVLFADLETYSETPISAGAYRYAQDASVLLFAYALSDSATSVWDVTLGEPMPPDLRAALEDPSVMTVWHNGAGFDRHVLRHALQVDIPVSRVHDTMTQALSHALPGALSALCDILKVPQERSKIADGKRLIHKFCKPLPKNHTLTRATRDTHPEDWARFVEYAGADIEATREVYKRLPNWNYPALDAERELFELDQLINDRGVYIDTELGRAAVAAVERAQEGLAKQTREITAGAVTSASQRDALMDWIAAQGTAVPNLQASTVERLLQEASLPPQVLEVLRVRAQASSTSTAKYARFLESTGEGGRLRGMLQFCGASRTGRWSGRIVQLQNMKRPDLKNAEVELGIQALKAGVEDLLFSDVMGLAGDAIRGCLASSPGSKLVVSDLSNIEGRVLAWLGGERWKLDAFRAFDGGVGEDLYKVAYGRAFRVAPSLVTDDQRQIGKVMELGLGFGGGVGAFSTFATAFGIDLEELALKARPTLPESILEQSAQWRVRARELKMPDYGLSDNAWVVCDALKSAWRVAHPGIVGFWRALGEAAMLAVDNPGKRMTAGPLVLRRDANWLRIKLPSGRCLCYPAVRVEKGELSYMGVNQFTRKWERVKTYAGKLAENATQAMARDVLAHGMVQAETNGYEIVCSIHDELICETPDTNEFGHEELSSLMATVPAWSPGLPLAAKGFESKRYRK